MYILCINRINVQLVTMSCDENTAKQTFDVQFKPFAESLTNKFTYFFPTYEKGLVQGEPGGFINSPEYGVNAEKLSQFKPRNDDVWVLSFPKCGKYISPTLAFKTSVNR